MKQYAYLLGVTLAIPFWIVYSYSKIPSATKTVATGLPGAQGLQGPRGLPGLKGPTGSQGSQGPHGLKGLAGPHGPTGPVGPTGPKGLSGATGPLGATGPSTLIEYYENTTVRNQLLIVDNSPQDVFVNDLGFVNNSNQFYISVSVQVQQLITSPAPSSLPTIRFYIKDTSTYEVAGTKYHFQDPSDASLKTLSFGGLAQVNPVAFTVTIGAETNATSSLDSHSSVWNWRIVKISAFAV